MKFLQSTLPLFFLCSLNIDAKEIVNYCFKKPTNIQENKRYIDEFAVSGEFSTYNVQKNCLEIMMKNKQREVLYDALVHKYISNKYSKNSWSSSTNVTTNTTVSKKSCNIKIITEKVGINRNNNFNIRYKNKINASYLNNKSSNKTQSTSMLLLQPGRPGSIQLAQDKIILKCFPQGSSSYEIEISLMSKNENKKKGEKVFSLSTQVRVQKAQRLNIGQIINQLKDGSNSIAFSDEPGFYKSSVNAKEKITFWLLVN
jgi:hypothetical protein